MASLLHTSCIQLSKGPMTAAAWEHELPGNCRLRSLNLPLAETRMRWPPTSDQSQDEVHSRPPSPPLPQNKRGGLDRLAPQRNQLCLGKPGFLCTPCLWNGEAYNAQAWNPNTQSKGEMVRSRRLAQVAKLGGGCRWDTGNANTSQPISEVATPLCDVAVT